MKNIRDYTTAILKISAIFIWLLLSAIILLAATGCTTSQNIKPSPEQSLLKIIIYTDFECGACGKLNSEIEPQLREFEAAGIAQIEIRLLGALSDDSLHAAEAALWAADHGRFPEFQDTLFRMFYDVCSEEKLVELANSFGLDGEALRHCLDSGSKKPELAKNMNMARADGVGTLPAVFINDFKIEGYKPLETYLRAIDRALAERSTMPL